MKNCTLLFKVRNSLEALCSNLKTTNSHLEDKLGVSVVTMETVQFVLNFIYLYKKEKTLWKSVKVIKILLDMIQWLILWLNEILTVTLVLFVNDQKYEMYEFISELLLYFP